MSSSERAHPRIILAFAVILALAGCTAGPLYADRSGIAGPNPVVALQGDIGISPAPDRTAQYVRNPLLFRLNRGTEVSQPIYLVDLGVTQSATGITLSLGNQLSTAAIRVTATYRLVEVASGEVLGAGTRTSTVPYDRTGQLYQQQRASLNAQEEASQDVAAQLELAIASDLLRAGRI